MKRLYRSRSNEMIAGVCGGLADYLNLDPTIVRLVFVILLFAGLGGFWIYLVLWVIAPLEPIEKTEPVQVEAGTMVEESEKPKKTIAAKKAAPAKDSEEPK